MIEGTNVNETAERTGTDCWRLERTERAHLLEEDTTSDRESIKRRLGWDDARLKRADDTRSCLNIDCGVADEALEGN